MYCGITLKSDYDNQILDTSMSRYIQKIINKYKHENPQKPQDSPHPVAPQKFGKHAHDPLPEDTTFMLNKYEMKCI